MGIADPLRAERKLAQVGYYRLSGYWFPAREFVRDQNQNVVLCRATKKTSSTRYLPAKFIIR